MRFFSLVNRIRIYLGIGVSDSRNSQDAVIRSNVQRMIYICCAGVIVVLLGILMFSFYEDSSQPDEILWRKLNIIIQFWALFPFLILATILSWYRKTHPVISLAVANISTAILFFIILAMGTLITCIDQLVTPAITPFIITCTVLSAALYIKPVISIAGFLFSYVLFYLAIPYTQHDPHILLSNRGDGLYAVGVGISLSIVMWRAALTRHKQNEIIELQKNDLEKNYVALQETTRALAKANATKDSFFTIIAHDIRTPVSNLNGFLNVMNQEPSVISDEQRTYYISLMADTAKATLKLLEDLLAWARAQKGEIAFHPASHSLHALCESNIRLFAQGAAYKKITLVNAIPEDMIVVFDYAMIDTVVRNLISNALKYTRENGEVRISVSVKEKQLEVSVSDTGIGMSEDILKSLFSIDGKQVSIQGTLGEKGTGLGLILCREFILLHNGSIRAESQEDSGSTFIFVIPQEAISDKIQTNP